MSQRADAIADLLAKARVLQENMTPWERREFWDDLKVGYCKYCGITCSAYSCQCWNDD